MNSEANLVENKNQLSRLDGSLELIIVILLGITALFTAWATWVGSLHDGNEATNFAKANNLSAEGNASWNEASQTLMQDYLTFNEMNSLEIDIAYAIQHGNDTEIERLTWKQDELRAASMTAEFQEAYDWAFEQTLNSDELYTPFDMEGYVDSYYADAQIILEESATLMAQADVDGAYGAQYGLVTVIFTVVLFILGIVSTFKKSTNKVAVVAIALVAFIIATIYMLTIPMPTDFNLMSIFSGETPSGE